MKSHKYTYKFIALYDGSTGLVDVRRNVVHTANKSKQHRLRTIFWGYGYHPYDIITLKVYQPHGSYKEVRSHDFCVVMSDFKIA